jgi:hypothetical protein
VTLGKSHGYTYVRDVLDVPPGGEDHVSVPCPGSDQFAFSGGAELFGGPEASYLTSQSGQLGNGWDTRAWDGFNLGATWAQAYSICRKFGLGDYLSYSSDHGVPAGPATETETTKCEDGKILSGGGYFAGVNAGRWYLTSSYPKQNGWAWEGYHLDGSDSSEIIGEAYCLGGSDKPEIASRSAKTHDEHVTLKVFCKHGTVTGGGGSASEDALNSHLVVTKPIDSKDKKDVPDDGWAVEWENDGLVKQTFTAYAVCH